MSNFWGALHFATAFLVSKLNAELRGRLRFYYAAASRERMALQAQLLSGDQAAGLRSFGGSERFS